MEVLQKKNSKKLFFIIGAIVLIAGIIAAIIVVTSNNSGNRVNKLIKAGNKYVSELDFEQAIVAFKQAIEIDPHNVDAYLGLADVYIAMAEESKGNSSIDEICEYYQNALDVLNDALSSIDDDESIKLINDKMAEILHLISETKGEDYSDPSLNEDNNSVDAVNNEGYSNIAKLIEDCNSFFNYPGSHITDEVILTKSYRAELSMPLIEELEDYISWLEKVKGQERYQELFTYNEELIDPNLHSISLTISDENQEYLLYLCAFRYLFEAHMCMDDLDGAFDVKCKMQEIFGDNVVSLDTHTIQGYLDGCYIIYDKYDRPLLKHYTGDYDEEETYEYNDDNQLIIYQKTYDGNLSCVVEYTYDMEGRIIDRYMTNYSFYDGVDSTHRLFDYQSFGTVIISQELSLTVEEKEYHYNEYGGWIDR